jgi:hypothetical protein
MKIKNFVPCPDEILREHGVYAAMIYGRIYRFSQKHGFCFASQDTIAEWINVSRSTVQKYISLLVKNDYIEDMDVGVKNRPHKYRPKKKFDFYADYIGDRETSTSEGDGNCETSTGGCETATGDREKRSTDRETSMNKGFKERIKKESEDNLSLSESPNRAWEAVLGQLQFDMAKATFDTWVRDSVCVAFEDGTFIIGTQNAYARDWLDSRLTSTVAGLLAGMMDRSVEVRWVVWQVNSKPDL